MAIQRIDEVPDFVPASYANSQVEAIPIGDTGIKLPSTLLTDYKAAVASNNASAREKGNMYATRPGLEDHMNNVFETYEKRFERATGVYPSISAEQ